MPWTWRYEKADGAAVSGAGLQEAIFASQGDAESWLGENWRELLDSGVDQVSLFDDARKQYGPMSLHPGRANLAPGAGPAPKKILDRCVRHDVANGPRSLKLGRGDARR